MSLALNRATGCDSHLGSAVQRLVRGATDIKSDDDGAEDLGGHRSIVPDQHLWYGDNAVCRVPNERSGCARRTSHSRGRICAGDLELGHHDRITQSSQHAG
jgi:hypothetical protein